MYVLNAPKAISVPFGIAKKFLEKNTVDKINISGKHTNPKMWEHINPQHVEEKYGGTHPNLTENFWYLKLLIDK